MSVQKISSSWEINTDQSLTEGQGLCQAQEKVLPNDNNDSMKSFAKKEGASAAERTTERRGGSGKGLHCDIDLDQSTLDYEWNSLL